MGWYALESLRTLVGTECTESVQVVHFTTPGQAEPAWVSCHAPPLTAWGACVGREGEVSSALNSRYDLHLAYREVVVVVIRRNLPHLTKHGGHVSIHVR